MSISRRTDVSASGPSRIPPWLLRGALGLAALLAGAPVRADITFYNVFKDESYTQNSNDQPTTPIGFQGSVAVNASSPTDLTGATVTSSSPLSPMTLTGSAGNYAFGEGFAAKSIMDTDFPNGTTYTFLINGGTFNGQTGTIATPASDQYSATVPYFTDNAFTMLQGVDASSTIHLTFNPYTSTGLNAPLTFIGITNVGTGQLVYGSSGSNTFSSATVAANTLAPGTTYDLDIVYSNRNATAGPPGFGNSTAFYAYDLRTDLTFTTASVPEPSALLLAGQSLAFVLGVSVFRGRISRRSAARVSTLSAAI